MVCGMPAVGPVAGGGRLGLRSRIALQFGILGDVPPLQDPHAPMRDVNRLFDGMRRIALRVVPFSLARAAIGADKPAEELLTSGPEPVNLVGLGLALVVLFLFRRFSRTS